RGRFSWKGQSTTAGAALWFACTLGESNRGDAMILLLAAFAAFADPAELGPITDAVWEPLRLSSEAMRSYYPQAALDKGADDAAVVECVAAKSGALEACKVIAETPAGLQFGEAALRLSSQFHMKPLTRSGQRAE